MITSVKTVQAIHIAPVKSLALIQPASVHVGLAGIAEDRRFFLLDQRGAVLTQRQVGTLVQIKPDYQPERDFLRLNFPDGTAVEGAVEIGEPVETIMWGRPVRGNIVAGDWSNALTRFCGGTVNLVQARQPGECFDEYPISLLSSASLDGLKQRPGVGEHVDERRFRPNFLLAGCQAHEEDTWLGGQLQLSDGPVLRVVAPDPRCAITTLNPDTGQPDLDTPSVIREYRPSAGPAFFGVYAVVERPGQVSVGDQVTVQS
ncbi:MAG: MOSC domain-containing protein [Chloroflexi bacterium]|nr:MOSC domain-containing protein [Chloroflexota bacterium]